MCNTTVHRPTAGFNGMVDPFSFSTFHLLRTCNRLMLPTDIRNYYALMKDSNNNNNNKILEIDREDLTTKSPTINPLKNLEISSQQDYNTIFPSVCPKEISPPIPSLSSTVVSSSGCSPLSYDYSTPEYSNGAGHNNRIIGDLGYNGILNRRQRGEKRPIPNDQKDEKYYERRKRNNEAAKKSRDARKMREDRIAFRAALLEQENAILRTQMVAMREEMNTLRQMISTSRTSQIPIVI